MGNSDLLRPSTPDSSSAARLEVPPSVRLGSLLAWLGVSLCFLLLQKDAGLHSFFCPPRGGCETVLGSQFATIRGIPLAWFGLAFYGFLLVLWLAVSAIASLRLRLWLMDVLVWVMLAGLTFSLGLMYLQFFKLHAFCPLCTTSAVIVAASVVTAWRARSVVGSGSAGVSSSSAWTLALFAMFPTLIFATGKGMESQGPTGLQLVDLATAHRLGPANAPVQIVVYSDFQCGFCRQLAPVLQHLEDNFPQKVAMLYRHFPLAGHPRAWPAAMASECAAEQGAFWKYHDKLFNEGGDLSDTKLLELASSLGLDPQRFQACLQSDRPREIVAAGLREATDLALPGAPGVFINGRRVEGPLTYEALAKRVDNALKALPAGASQK
ncbi:DSBA oxidoreductase [Chthoniobacter flavus Ellin428]|uniref:DSBA oxidoreductase n=1 Tax=Chthoniobacter flavus Ellin428 TaxID=497964 RepID=B4DAG6_9BACT|nr:DSBA oxidoreductase [Chthoniobacter flavus Ellin428]TCO91954.1 vitamin K epoxide reductase family protein [Chthoniobacter flavus]